MFLIQNMETMINRIIIDQKIMVGKPIVKGTRITVSLVLNLLANGQSIESIIEEYKLEREDVYACLAYANQIFDEVQFIPLEATA